MGLISVPASAAASATTGAPASPSTLLLFDKQSRRTKSSTTTGPFHGRRRQRRRAVMTCRAASRGDGDGGLLWLPRRDVLLTGLTGVATAGLTTAYPGLASDAAPDEGEKCSNNKVTEVKCTPANGLPCPPPSSNDDDPFVREKEVKRVRKPVHCLSKDERNNYKRAVAKMKALPESHPLSFKAQAAIHEAYCDSHYYYTQAQQAEAGPDPKDVFDVHFSWVFAPWHRMYIYFYERALGELIGDDTFALPYWAWDLPAGMIVPPLFKEDDCYDNPLHDSYRDPAHLDKLVQLDFPGSGKPPIGYKDTVYRNLCTVYQQQISKGKSARDFLGDKLCTAQKLRVEAVGKEKRGASGKLESMAHTAMHLWVGKPKNDTTACEPQPGPNCRNDMGFLGTAARDPLFYSHHANVDRLWHLWTSGPESARGEGNFDDPDWLQSSFVFYDGVKNPRRVRITIEDVLNTKHLGYRYDDEKEEDLPWIKCELSRLVTGPAATAAGVVKKRSKRQAPPPVTSFQPLTLSSKKKGGGVVEVRDVVVPGKGEGSDNKKKQQRLDLVIQGIEYDPTVLNKFDVAINVPKDLAPNVGPQYFEYAGSFAVVPSSKAPGGSGTLQTKVSLCIDQLLPDIGIVVPDVDDGTTTVNVVLVPRTEGEIKINDAPEIVRRF